MEDKIKYFLSQILKNYNKFSLIYFIFLLKINIILNECNRSNPFKLYNDTCFSNCSDDDFQYSKCILDNSILKEQYPNNIILVSVDQNSYFNFLTFSNGDFIFEAYSSDYYYHNKKKFFGLRKNGTNYFYNNTEDNYFCLLNTDNNNYLDLYGANSIFVNDGEEYFLNILGGNYYTEIYDFNKKRHFSELTSEILGFKDENYRGSLIYLGNNIYIYSASIYNNSILEYQPVVLKFKLNLDNLDDDYNINSIIIKKAVIGININSKMTSCFKTEKSGIIICFCDFKDNGDNQISYYIIAYNQDLEYLCEEKKIILYHTNSFIYSIPLKDDIGAFIYYKNNYPTIFFREYENKSFKNYFEEIILDKFYFNTSLSNNDLIKISNNKLGFFSISQKSKNIYIFIINLFNNKGSAYNNHIKIRYYSIELYNSLNHRITQNLKAHTYNDFIILGIGKFYSEYYFYFTNFENSLMIIGYPNINDTKFDIIYYIKQNNCSISNLIVNLTENLTIDNNIFGYKYKAIKIHNINKSGNIYLETDNNETLDNKINSELYNSNLYIKFKDNSYIKSNYSLEYSIIVTESNYEENEKYPINIIDINGKEGEEEFNNNKKEYIGKTIYYDIFLSENISENCTNSNCKLCREDGYRCLTFKSDEESENFKNNNKKYTDLELLYITIIFAAFCIIPYCFCSSFQNLRIFFFIFQLIFYCVIFFTSKYKNNYLWEDTTFEPIQQLPCPVITDIKVINYSYIYLYHLELETLYQNFSLIKTDEYSKECLLNYFVKITDKCPITDIVVINNSEKYYYSDLTYYSSLKFFDVYIYYKRNSKYGKLYNSYKKFIRKDYIFYEKLNITFLSELDYKNILMIKLLEENKLLIPFSRLKKICYFTDYLWCIIFPISLFYYIIETRDDKKWNYFRVIDYFLQIILFAIYIVRFIFFIDVKNFYKYTKDICKNMDINIELLFKIDKYRNTYYPNLNVNAESLPVAIVISMIFYFCLFLLTGNKWSYQRKNFGNEKYYFFNDTNELSKRKFRIYYLLFPFIMLYIATFILDIFNDIKIKKIYNNSFFNWELSPIKEIKLSDNETHEIAHILMKDKDYYFYSWKENFISVERYDDYNYMNLYENKDGKICGKDSFGNDLYFPNDLNCPINHIYIDNIPNGLDSNYSNIDLGNYNYLHYTNSKIDGQILVDIKAGSSLFPLELNSKNSNDLCESLKNETVYSRNCKDYNKFNTIPFYSKIDKESYNKFIQNNTELKIWNDIDIFLYGLTYQGINSTSINKTISISIYKKQIEKIISLFLYKNIFSGLTILLFIYFSIVLLLEEKVKKPCFFYISLILIILVVCNLIIIIIYFDINIKYIQSIMNKINKDFENNKINYIWTLFLIIFNTFYLVFYICIILYVFMIGDNSLYNLDSNKICDKINNLLFCEKKEEKQIHRKEKSQEVLSSNKNELENKCLLYLTEKVLITFEPCGHKCCCLECYEKNQNDNRMKSCPLCKENIIGIIDKIYSQ